MCKAFGAFRNCNFEHHVWQKTLLYTVANDFIRIFPCPPDNKTNNKLN